MPIDFNFDSEVPSADALIASKPTGRCSHQFSVGKVLGCLAIWESAIAQPVIERAPLLVERVQDRQPDSAPAVSAHGPCTHVSRVTAPSREAPAVDLNELNANLVDVRPRRV